MPISSKRQNLFWMIIPAAGMGSRFNKSEQADEEKDKKKDRPKQYRQLTSAQTIAQYTIEQVIKQPDIAGLIVAIHPEDKLSNSSIYTPHSKPVHRVPGGATRTLSVFHALNFARQKELVQMEDWVLIHDIARPLVSQEEISQLTTCINDHATHYQGISLSLPINDSVKRIDQSQPSSQSSEIRAILRSEQREVLWRSITPQAARMGSLLTALQQHKDNPAITDEMSALALIQAPCALIRGNEFNIKITTTQDLALAKTYLRKSS